MEIDQFEKLSLNPYMTELCQTTSAIRKMDQIASEMEEKYGRGCIHNFSIGNPRVPPPEEYNKIMIETIQDKEFFLPHGYAPNTGDKPAREAMAELFSKLQDVKLTYKNVILSSGCAGAINIFLRTILSVGDEVIVPNPCFLEYPFYVDNYHGKIVRCDTKFEDGWQINKEEFEKCFTARTRCVIINSPHNPTGIVYTDETIKMISKVCENFMKKYGRTIWILSDEVYCRMIRPGKRPYQIFKNYKFSVISYSVSKDLSLPGERVGALIMNPEVKLCERNIHALSMANEFLSIYPPNRLHMRALPQLLKHTSNLEAYTECQEIVEESLKKLNIEYIQPEGAFYVFPKIPDGIDEMAFCKTMVKNFIVVVPGSAFGKAGFYRMTFCHGVEAIKKAMAQFEIAYKKTLEELGHKENEKKEEKVKKIIRADDDTKQKNVVHNN